MPELPEVEVARRTLAPALEGRQVAGVRTTRDSGFFLTPPGVLKKRLPGRTIRELERRGKYLLAGLDDGSRLLLHLGMTGQLFLEGAQSLRLLSSTGRAALAPESQASFRPDRHTHMVLSFGDEGPRLFFRDVRRFGRVGLLEPGGSDSRLERLGVDALEATAKDLSREAAGRRAAIKTLLLDQSVLAGVGNIYADEALFLARVHPARPAGEIPAAACGRIVKALQRVMRRSIETGGSSISDYVAPDGRDGGYQDERKVYGREGEPCPACGGVIGRIVLSGRSSHFCPRCQPAP